MAMPWRGRGWAEWKWDKRGAGVQAHLIFALLIAWIKLPPVRISRDSVCDSLQHNHWHSNNGLIATGLGFTETSSCSHPNGLFFCWGSSPFPQQHEIGLTLTDILTSFSPVDQWSTPSSFAVPMSFWGLAVLYKCRNHTVLAIEFDLDHRPEN